MLGLGTNGSHDNRNLLCGGASSTQLSVSDQDAVTTSESESLQIKSNSKACSILVGESMQWMTSLDQREGLGGSPPQRELLSSRTELAHGLT